MSGHELGSATHTVELDQIHGLNAHLEVAGSRRPTAAELQMTGTPVHPRGPGKRDQSSQDAAGARRLSGDERLVRLFIEGPPDYPYVWAAFHPSTGSRADAEAALLVASVHTPTLRRLSAWFGLSHRWGTDPNASGSRTEATRGDGSGAHRERPVVR